MNSIILHISDLHISLDKAIGGGFQTTDSFLTTDKSEEKSNHYIDKFVQSVKTTYDGKKIYLLITGDITNAGEKKEFDYAKKFITRIIDNLSIDKCNVLIIPGDHDLNRRDITNLLVENEDAAIEEINIAKFDNFKNFFFDLLGKNFDPNKVIFDTLVVEESIILLGLNSCLRIDLKNTLGNVDIEKFEKEFAELNFSDLKPIACVHHNFTSSHENKNGGQWDLENREIFVSKLLTFQINFIFTGNEHTNSCKSLFLGELITSDSGTLSSKGYESAFKIYPIIKNDDIILQNKIYSLHKTGGNDSQFEWDIRTNKIFKQPDEFVLFRKEPPKIDDEIDNSLPTVNLTDFALENKTIVLSSQTQNIYNKPEFTDVLYDKVKELKIFHTGHFHWSETSRAHNWIDVSKLIEDKDNLNFLKDAITDVIETKIGEEKIDLIIGLGYEGNILATKSAIKYSMPYSFLPYSYRHDEHHEFETELNFDNNTGEYKNVLIITDVVNDGRTIRKLIKKRQEQFFNNAEKIYVVSLFYTGNSILNYDILNYNFIEQIEGYDLVTDEEVNNIEYYTVKSLKVEKCPYGKNFREECFIYKDELSCVNLFYDEGKYR